MHDYMITVRGTGTTLFNGSQITSVFLKCDEDSISKRCELFINEIGQEITRSVKLAAAGDQSFEFNSKISEHMNRIFKMKHKKMIHFCIEQDDTFGLYVGDIMVYCSAGDTQTIVGGQETETGIRYRTEIDLP